MLRKIKKLSFNARLVIVMNLSMAVIMLAAGGLFSWSLLKNFDKSLEHEILVESKIIHQAIRRFGEKKEIVQEFISDIANNDDAVKSIEVLYSSETVASFSKDQDMANLSTKEFKQNDATVKIQFTYDLLRKEKTESLASLVFYMCFAMVFFSVVLFFISRKLIQPLQDVAHVLTDATKSTGEHALKLKEMSASVESSGNIIDSGSEDTTSSMRGLTEAIEKSAGELKKCLQLANAVNSKADQGTGVMNRLVNSMEVIEEANKKLNELGSIFEEISSKTSVINDIVFKTQLLSFNASIEAARAGQHGRGFSVVAEEIGNLAQMSGKSATEISNLLSSSEEHVKDIISGTDEKIAEGRNVSLEALQSFDDIRRDIGEITDSIGEVTQNSEGQESVIKNTLDTMVDMKETVLEQGIFTRSIGKSAAVINEQSDVLNETQRKVANVIFGGEEAYAKRKLKKEKVLNLVSKMKNKDAA